jgi:two-component system cell cycle response regulator
MSLNGKRVHEEGMTTRRAPEIDGRVLVVDDDEDSRRLLTHLLERTGCQVVAADSGRAAIQALSSHEVDVVLLDVMMPKMDGFEVCRELKRTPATATLPVILITAKDDMETRAEGMNLGVSEFLAKPVNKNELYARVQTQINAGRRARELDRTQKRVDDID